MKPFSQLLNRLLHTPQRSAKERLLADYFSSVPDPDRGYALAAITGGLNFRHAKAGMIRELAGEVVDPVLFALSYDFVGDLAETVALIWPDKYDAKPWPRLAQVVPELAGAGKSDVPSLVRRHLDTLDSDGRWAFLKLLTGGLRVGVSTRSAKLALAAYSHRAVEDIEEVWHSQTVPYTELFEWLDGRGDKPNIRDKPIFYPPMLANPLEERHRQTLDLSEFAVEWKWDGIRVQLVSRQGEVRLYSRTGDDISGAFPDIVGAVDFEAVLDGELLVRRGDIVAPFNDLQQRLNRKMVTPAMLRKFPAFIHVYDLLFDNAEDLRPQPLLERRRRLEEWFARTRPVFADLPAGLPATDWDRLDVLRRDCRQSDPRMGELEGLMLKRWDSPYLIGRPQGQWYKWKRDPLTADCVLMYAQRGHGKRSSFFSDFTFGAWREPGVERELVPVGKAYFGFTDRELTELDRWVRANTIDRFGPVRQVRPELVIEVAFDSVQKSSRHKSGIAMRFPRFHRIRWDKPAREADELATLEALIG